jgi:hypothetical protein
VLRCRAGRGLPSTPPSTYRAVEPDGRWAPDTPLIEPIVQNIDDSFFINRRYTGTASHYLDDGVSDTAFTKALPAGMFIFSKAMSKHGKRQTNGLILLSLFSGFSTFLGFLLVVARCWSDFTPGAPAWPGEASCSHRLLFSTVITMKKQQSEELGYSKKSLHAALNGKCQTRTELSCERGWLDGRSERGT